MAVLVGPYQSKGDWTSPSFDIAGGQWNIGWAFECSPAPAGAPSFEVFVVPAGSSVSAAAVPAVNESGSSGQSVTSQSTSGSQEIVVEAGSSCVWAVKVTGVA